MSCVATPSFTQRSSDTRHFKFMSFDTALLFEVLSSLIAKAIPSFGLFWYIYMWIF